jgi:hypothetical protein
MVNLDEVWQSALDDRASVNLDNRHHYARLNRGIKIIKDRNTSQIKIYNTLVGGDHYVELAPSYYRLFESEGWVVGCCTVALDSYRTKLERIEYLIRRETNSKKNKKKIDALKNNRARVMNRYFIVSQRLKDGKH